MGRQYQGDIFWLVFRTQIGAGHAVFGVHVARFFQLLVPCGECRTKGTASVTGGGLDPETLERAVAEDFAVGHAIQRHAARHAEVLDPVFLGERARRIKSRAFAHFCYKGSDGEYFETPFQQLDLDECDCQQQN